MDYLLLIKMCPPNRVPVICGSSTEVYLIKRSSAFILSRLKHFEKLTEHLCLGMGKSTVVWFNVSILVVKQSSYYRIYKFKFINSAQLLRLVNMDQFFWKLQKP